MVILRPGGNDVNDDNNHSADTVAGRLSASMASQQGVGVLPQWAARADTIDRDNSVADRAALKRRDTDGGSE